MLPSDVERDTQKENSYKKHAFRKRLPVTATLGRVNEAHTEMRVVKSAGLTKCNLLLNVS